MRRRKLLSLGAVGVIAGAGACAQISGLGDYSTGGERPGGDSAAPMDRPDVGAVDATDEAGDEEPGDGYAGPIGDEQQTPGEEEDGGNVAARPDADGRCNIRTHRRRRRE